jgi:hypothetical protein
MSEELRCPSRLHGILMEGRLEVKCHSRRCGAGHGVIVLHYFDPLTSELMETRRFQEPATFVREHPAERQREMEGIQ